MFRRGQRRPASLYLAKVDTVAVDGLATQGVKAWTAIILTSLSRNIVLSALEGLIPRAKLLGPFYWHSLTLIPAWRSNYINRKTWDEIIYPFLNFNDAAVEV